MKRKLAWWVVGVLVLVLALVVVSCGGAAPAPVEEPAKQPAVEQPGPKPAAEQPKVAEPITPAGGPSAIPHSLVGRDDCLVCHGATGIKPYPADHAGRTNATCTACHQPAG